MARYLDPELYELVSAQKAEIERLRGELAVAERVGGKLMEEREQLGHEIERLRLDLSNAATRLKWHDETLAERDAEIERLRLQVKMIPLPEYRDDPRLHEVIEEQKAEIERLREEFAAERSAWENVVADKYFENERLRGLLEWWIDAGPDADWDDYEKRVREALDKANG